MANATEDLTDAQNELNKFMLGVDTGVAGNKPPAPPKKKPGAAKPPADQTRFNGFDNRDQSGGGDNIPPPGNPGGGNGGDGDHAPKKARSGAEKLLLIIAGMAFTGLITSLIANLVIKYGINGGMSTHEMMAIQEKNILAESTASRARADEARVKLEIMKFEASQKAVANGRPATYVPQPLFASFAPPSQQQKLSAPPVSTNQFALGSGNECQFGFAAGATGVQEPRLNGCKTLKALQTSPGQMVRIPYQAVGGGIALVSGKHRVKVQAGPLSEGKFRTVCQNIDPAEEKYSANCNSKLLRESAGYITPNWHGVPGDEVTLGGAWLEVLEATVITVAGNTQSST